MKLQTDLSQSASKTPPWGKVVETARHRVMEYFAVADLRHLFQVDRPHLLDIMRVSNVMAKCWRRHHHPPCHNMLLGRCRCSGDDAVNIAGHASPIIRDCELHGKRCGLRVYGHAAGLVAGCNIKDCGEPGIQAMDRATTAFCRWDILLTPAVSVEWLQSTENSDLCRPLHEVVSGACIRL